MEISLEFLLAMYIFFEFEFSKIIFQIFENSQTFSEEISFKKGQNDRKHLREDWLELW